jgi:hypothetical protein
MAPGEQAAVYPVHRVESWAEYVSLITDSPYENWAFRGQADGTRPLLSTLSRRLMEFGVRREVWPRQEERILRIFKRKAHQRLDPVPDPADDLQWLALMQHHGAPTRLLDVSWSPYVAAFFALDRATGEAAVWAFNPARVTGPGPVPVRGMGDVFPDEMSPETPGNYARLYLPGDKPFVWCGDPAVMNVRLTAQSGTFLVPGVLDEPVDDLLARYPDPADNVVKFVLPADRVRRRGMSELYRMNITHATLFPDLDGLARSLAYELEHHWAFDPRTLEQRR